jgi:hypothetical protein
MMVAMNPQTWDQDVREIDPGGYLFYDSSKPLPRAKFRDDIHVLGMPLTEICNQAYSDARERQLFKNIIYIGALTALLDIDPAEIEKLFGEQYKGKEKLFDANVQALNLGRDYAQPPQADCAQGRAPRRGRRPHLRRWQQRRRAGLHLRRRDGLRVVSDHAIVFGRRSVQRYAQKLRVDPETGAASLRDRPGRGRAGVDRHGARRRLERRALIHRHFRPRHLADERVHRARLLRRDPGGGDQRPARWPVHRHADAHAAGRHAGLRLRLARRHPARAAVSRGSLRVLRDVGAGARPRRAPADAGLRA